MNAILRRKSYAGNPHVNSRAFALLVGVAASLVSWRGLAAGDGTIKVVGGNDIQLSTEGVYVEYEFNGKRYRSNECGSGFNATAWKHLSDEDKAKVVKFYGWSVNNRIKDFGSDCSGEIVDFAQPEWRRAREQLRDEWAAHDLPEYFEKFDKNKRGDYFTDNLAPRGPDGSEISRSAYTDYPELGRIVLNQQQYFVCACEAYEALERGTSRLRQIAIQSVAGDLIQLITDRCLVPNITPSGMSGELGNAVGTILDYLNTVTGAQDKLIEKYVGQRVSADDFTEALIRVREIAAAHEVYIGKFMEKVQEYKREAEAYYQRVLEDERERIATLDQIWQENIARTEAASAIGDPDPAIVETVQSYDSKIDAIESSIVAIEQALEKTGDNKEREALRARLKAEEDARQAEENARRSALQEKAREVINELSAWGGTYYGMIDSLVKGMPEHVFPHNEELYEAEYAIAHHGGVDTPEEDYQNWKSLNMAYADWLAGRVAPWESYQKPIREFVDEGLRAYADILERKNAIPEDIWAFDNWALSSQLRTVRESDQVVVSRAALNILGGGNGTIEVSGLFRKIDVSAHFKDIDWCTSTWPRSDNIAPQVAKIEATIAEYDTRRAAFQNGEMMRVAAHAEAMANYDLAVQAYYKAYDAYKAAAEGAPDYIRDQELASFGLVIASDSVLGRMFILSDASASDARRIRDELKRMKADISTWEKQMEVAKSHIEYYGGLAFRYGEGPGDINQLSYPTTQMLHYSNIVDALLADFMQDSASAELLDCTQLLLKSKSSYLAGENLDEYEALRVRAMTAAGRRILLRANGHSSYVANIPGYFGFDQDFYGELLAPTFDLIDNVVYPVDVSSFTMPLQANVEWFETGKSWRELAWFDSEWREIPSRVFANVLAREDLEMVMTADGFVPTDVSGLDEDIWVEKGLVRISGEVNFDESLIISTETTVAEGSGWYATGDGLSVIVRGTTLHLPVSDFGCIIGPDLVVESGATLDVIDTAGLDWFCVCGGSIFLEDGATFSVNGIVQDLADWDFDYGWVMRHKDPDTLGVSIWADEFDQTWADVYCGGDFSEMALTDFTPGNAWTVNMPIAVSNSSSFMARSFEIRLYPMADEEMDMTAFNGLTLIVGMSLVKDGKALSTIETPMVLKVDEWGGCAVNVKGGLPSSVNLIEGATLVWSVRPAMTDDPALWAKISVWGDLALMTYAIPSLAGDPGAEMRGNAEYGFTIYPSENATSVHVIIPEGLPADKVTVEITEKVTSVILNGASLVLWREYGEPDMWGWRSSVDIMQYLKLPEADAQGAIDLTKATVRDEIVKEVFDTDLGAEVKIDATNPSITTAPTTPGLVYTFREGTTLEGLNEKAPSASKIGDGEAWSPTISVKGGASAFYSISVGK